MTGTTDTPATTDSGWRRYLPLLVLAGFCAYVNSFRVPLLFDDDHWITDDPNYYNLSHTWQFMRSPFFVTRPFTGVTLIVNYEIGGLNVLGYHLVNLFVHLFAGLALFGVARRTFLLPQWKDHYRDNAAGLALAVALFWTVHPMQTQSVTYIIQRCESMMGMFLFLTLYCSIRAWDSERRVAWQLAAVVACTLGMGSKEVMAGAPILVVLYDFVFLAPSWRDAWRRRWPLYVGLAATWSVALLGRIGTHLISPSFTFGWRYTTPLEYLLTQPGVILYYIRQSLWPASLCFDHENWPIAESVHDWLWPGLVVAALGFLTVRGIIERRWWGFVGAWFFIVLGPTSSFIPISDPIFEHRMYVPIASIVVLVVLAGDVLLTRVGQRLGASSERTQRLRAGAIALVSGILLVLTLNRNHDYRSRMSLYHDTLLKNPRGEREAYHLANDRFELGDAAGARGPAFHALAVFRNPFPMTYQLCGRIELHAGNYTKAVEYLTKGLEERLEQKANALMALGLSYYFLGEPSRAIAAFGEAIRLDDRADHRLARALALHDAGQKKEGAAEVHEALRLDSGCAERAVRDARRFALTRTDNPMPHARRALFLARAACLVNAEDPWHLDTLAVAHAAVGQFPQAVDVARQALAKAGGDTPLAREIAARLRLFEKRQPYRLETFRAGADK